MVNPSSLETFIKLMLTEGLGLDLSDPNLSGTPQRIARMYLEEFFVGVGKEFDDFTVFPNTKKYSQLIISEEIDFVSVCSHHFLPFNGRAYFGYIPDEYVVGLSKLSRVVCHYAARPQLQENLTHEILECFVNAVKPKGAMLILRAFHQCQSLRGAKQANAMMTTSALYGVFETNEATRQEMLSLIHFSK